MLLHAPLTENARIILRLAENSLMHDEVSEFIKQQVRWNLYSLKMSHPNMHRCLFSPLIT